MHLDEVVGTLRYLMQEQMPKTGKCGGKEKMYDAKMTKKIIIEALGLHKKKEVLSGKGI